MTLNQQAVYNYLNALKTFHPFEYKLMLAHGMTDLAMVKEIKRITYLPATWKNQAKQLMLLLKGDQ